MNEPGEQPSKVDPEKTKQLEADTGMLVDKPPTLPHLAITENSPPYVPIKEDDSPLPTEQREAAEEEAKKAWETEQRFKAMREAIDSETDIVEGVLAERAKELYSAHKEKGDLLAQVDDIANHEGSRYKRKIRYGKKDKVQFKDPTGFTLRKNKEYETAYRFRTRIMDKNGVPQYPMRVGSVIKDRGGEAVNANPTGVTVSLGREEDYPEGGQPELRIRFDEFRNKGKIREVQLRVNEKVRDRAMSHEDAELDHRAVQVIDRFGGEYRNFAGYSHLSVDIASYNGGREKPKLSMGGHVYEFNGGDALISADAGLQTSKLSVGRKDIPSNTIPEVLHDILSLIPIENLFETGQQQPAIDSKDTA